MLILGDPLPEPQLDPNVKRWASMNGPSRSASLNMASPRDGHDEDGGPTKPLVSAQAFAFDQWVYKDPQVNWEY
jgi:hypothetical protein